MIAIYPHHYAEKGGFKLLSLQPEYIELLQMTIEQFENSQTVFFDMQLVATAARREELERVRSLEGSEGIHAIAAMTRVMRQEQQTQTLPSGTDSAENHDAVVTVLRRA